MSYLDKATALYNQIGQGDLHGAVDQFYDENIEVIEATGDTFQGRKTQKERILEWQQGIEALHGGGVHSITSNEEAGVTTVESWTDATFKQGGRMKFEEVAVQQWDGDRIVRERFYYNLPG